MKKTLLKSLISLWVLLIPLLHQAQVLCDQQVPYYNDILPGCTICSFPYTGSSTGYTPGPLTDGNYGCGNLTIENDQYFIFIANNSCVDFTIDAWNCVRPGGSSQRGLQGFIFDLNLTMVFDCTQGNQNTSDPQPFTVNSCGLIPGQAYLLVIDGYGGSECDFTVTASGTQGGDFVTIDPAGPFCDTDPPFQLTFNPPGGTWTGPVSSTGVFDPAAAGPGTHTITYSYTNPYGCMDDDQIDIVVNPTPDVMITPAAPLCENDPSIVINATPSGGTWTGPIDPDGTFDPATAGPGTHTVTYTVDQNGCMDSEDLDITVFEAPDVSIDRIDPMCENDPPTTATATPPGGTWGGDIGPNGEIDPSTLGPGTFSGTYTYTNSDGCTDDDMITFEIFSAPIVMITPAGPFCDNDPSVTLSATPSGGTWGGAAGGGGTFDPGANGPGTHTVTYTYTDGNNCTDDDQMDITVFAAPVVTLTPAGPFCENDAPVTLNGTPAGGTWTGPVSPTGEFDPASAGPGSHTINYSFTNSDGCSEKDEITIEVYDAPVVTIDPIAPLCENDGVVTASATPPGGIWGGDVSPGGTIDPAALGPGTYTATYNYTDSRNCSGSDMIMFTINAAPTVTLDPAGPFCESDAPVILNGTPPGGTWTGPVSSTGEFDPASAGPGSHTINYSFTNSDGCSEKAEIIIDVNPDPTPFIDDPGLLCEDDPPIVLTATPAGGTWSGVAGPNGEIDPAALGSGAFTVTYSFTDGNGCTGTDDLQLIINPLPMVDIQPIPPLCENDDPYTASATPAGGFWSGDIAPGGTIDPGVLGPGTFTGTYVYTDANGCSDTDDITFTINPAPNVLLDPAGPLCENGPVITLNYSPAGGTWTGPVSSTGQFDPQTTGPGIYTITYSFANSFGCTVEESIDIEVIDIPDIFFLSDRFYCQTDDPIFLNADPPGGVWSGAVGSNGYLDPSTLSPGDYDVIYTYTDPFGCSDAEIFQITILSAPDVTVNPAGPLCDNDQAIQLTATPSGGLWGGDVGSSGIFDPAFNGPGIWLVTYEYTDAGGCTAIAELEITVYESPQIFIDPIDVLCEESPIIQMTASPPGGTWGGAAFPNGQVNPAILSYGFHDVTYTVTNANSCTSDDFIIIEVAPPPVITFGYTGPFCLRDDVQFLDADPAGGFWEGDVDYYGEFIPSDLGPGWFTAIYNAVDFNGCTNVDSTNFQILEPFDITFPGDSVFCQTQGVITLQAEPSGGDWVGNIISPSGQIDPAQLAIGTYTVTYLIEDQLGNCIIEKDHTIEIIGPPDGSINGDTTFCTTAGMQQFTGTPAGGAWSGILNSNGQVDADSLMPGDFTAIYTVNYGDNCEVVFEQSIRVTPPPTAELSGSGALCPGGTNEADLQITLTGNNPWQIIYAVDGVTQVPVTANTNPFTLTVSQPGVYTLENIVESGGCANAGQGTATVTTIDPIAVNNLMTNCDGTATNYTVSFEITGGDPASYNVTGISGSLSGSAPTIFTSDPIPSGQGFNFTVSDNSGCAPVSDGLPLVDCACETEVGDMNLSIIRFCGVGSITATYDDSGEFLDADDLVQFVLHTNSGISLGTILALSTTPTFTFDPNTMQFGTTYYISAIAGSDDGTGNVDLSDNCLKVAAGTPIVFHQIPEATLSGNESICIGETATLNVDFTGRSPWTLRYFNGMDTITLNGISGNPYPLNVQPQNSRSYQLISVRNNFCDGTVSGNATVAVNFPPEVSNTEINCDSTYTSYRVTFAISGGDTTTYTVTGGNGSLSGNVFTSAPIPSGAGYNFSVTDVNDCAPVSVEDDIVDCGCLTSVGDMANNILRICGNGPAIGDYDDLLEELDADDLVRFVLHSESGLNLGNLLAINDIPEFSFDPGQMTYGTTYYISAIAGSDDGTGNVNLSDPCLDIAAGQPVIFRALPSAVLSGDFSICRGGDTTLTLTLTGEAPWTVVYNNGNTDRTLTATSSPFTFSVSPNQTTHYSLVSVRDANCPGAVSGAATIQVNTPPKVQHVIVECNIDKTEYTVTFEVSGGDSTSYYVDGDAGTLSGNIFVSEPIPNGQGYSFTVGDGNGCGTVPVVSATVECECETEAGTLQPGALSACVGETIVAFHNGDEFLDINDTLLFVLHDGSIDNPGNILLINNIPEFGFDTAVLNTGITYFISAVAGNSDVNNGINFLDPCLSVSIGVPLIFYPLPSVDLTADTTVCRGDEVALTLVLNGTAPFDVSLSDGQHLTGIQSGTEIRITPVVSTTITVLSVSDQHCQAAADTTVTITVNEPPVASVTPQAEICNTDQNGDPTVLDFSTLILGGDAGGSWEDVDVSGATGNLPVLDFDGITPGQYRFRYTTNTAQPPCEENTYLVVLTVRDCSCPSVATTPPPPVCNDNAVIDLAVHTVTTEAGSWRIANAPVGSTASINGTIFDASGSVAGDYTVVFELNQTPPAGCPPSSTQTIAVSGAVSAGTSAGVTSLCTDNTTSVQLTDYLNGETPDGQWTEISAVPSGSFDTGSGILNLNNIAPGRYDFEYVVTATPPCTSDTSIVSFNISHPVSAGVPVATPELCTGADSVFNLFSLIENYSPGGVWSEISAIPSSSGAFDAGLATFNTAGQVSGIYTFEYAVQADAPCRDDAVEVQIIVNVLPVAEAGPTGTITCNGRRITLDGSGSSTGSGINYHWSGNVSDAGILSPETNEPGIYILTVTNTETGCTATDSVEVTQDRDLPLLNANSVSVTCFGLDNGTIQVENVTGGTPPYEFSLNGAPFSTQNTFLNLVPGIYTLEMRDANDCRDQLTFEISEPEELTVTLSVNLDNESNIIQLGDSVLLAATVTGAFDTLIWSPENAFLPCDPEAGDDCLEHWVNPEVVTTYSVVALNENGCADEDDLTIFVERVREVYIPSAFSPNGDQINDQFRIYAGPNVEKVNSFLVFDRWGEVVFEYYDFYPDEPAAGWDGIFRQKPMNSGVFVYYAEIKFKDGATEFYKGDVTLIR